MNGTETKVTWDYSALARPYLKRPDYSPRGLDGMLAIARVESGADVCDVGAGIGHLTIPLAQRGLKMTAVEPNDAMRELGAERTAGNAAISWKKGTGEATGCPSNAFDFVSFGSSFNVTDRAVALRETQRLLKPRGWFACMWNHRDLDNPLQAEVEGLIRSFIPDYDYGSRREDQSAVIRESGLFDPPFRIEAPVEHEVTIEDWVEAWRSHATLERQAGGRLHEIVDAIAALLARRGGSTLVVPYTTRIWVAQARR